MTNEQLKGARRAMNQYPDLVFRYVTGGIVVGTQTVPITQHMSAEDVYRACRAAAVTQ
jgi:hypothetical protein